MSPPTDESRPRAESGDSSSGNNTESSATPRQDRAAARRRHKAAQRLAPLASGDPDPWAARAGAEAVTADPYAALAYERMSNRAWLAACHRLENLAASSEQRRRNMADLLRHRADDYRGRAAA